MAADKPFSFHCANCNALYQVVGVEPGPETVDRAIKCRNCGNPLASRKGNLVLKLVAVVAGGVLLAPTFVNAGTKPDKAAMKQATATCRAEVKEHAKYNAMSLWAQHKAVKKCVADALAKH